MLAIFVDPAKENIVHLLYLVHILAVIAAFGPTFFYHRLRRTGEMQAVAYLHMRLVFPALVVLWVAGMGMAGMNKFDLAQMWWITITIALWLVALVVSWFMIRPALTDASETATKKLSAGLGVTHLVLALSLWLMIFKPFVDGIYVIKP